MASVGLTWALNNGLTREQYDKQIFDFFTKPENANLTDAQIESSMNQWGIGADDVSRVTGVSVNEINKRLDLATPKTAAEIAYDKAAMDELATRQGKETSNAKKAADAKAAADAKIAADARAAEVARLANAEAARIAALNKTAADAKIAADARAAEAARLAALKTTTPTNTANFSTFTNFLKTPGLTDQQIAAEMNRLGISNSQVADLTGVGINDVNTRFNAVAPFSNATQGFAQNFANYTSIPIGAQYNPGVTAGGASPYSQVMGQMRPVGNPYAGVVGNLSMGGYNPALYDQIAAANLARDIAAKGGTTLADYYGAGAANSSADAAAATAADSAAAAAASASGTAPGSDGTPGSGAAKGGYVHGGLMFGPNPPGPDDGAVNLDLGEYVIKKSSVDKYGRGLLDMINEGKVPAKKLKSLLG